MSRLALGKIYTVIILFCFSINLAFALKTKASKTISNNIIIQHIESQLQSSFPALKIDSIVPSPIANMYQVNSRDKSFYVDSSDTYAIFGDMVNLHTKVNITKEGINAKLKSSIWDKLPLNLAIKRVIGSGESATIAVITDPNCPFCRQLEANLTELKNITIYYFLYPLAIHDNSLSDAKRILCSNVPLNTYLAKMATPDISLPHNMTCSDAKNLAIIKRDINEVVTVQGTPTIILSDGSTIVGAAPLSYLRQNIFSATKFNYLPKGSN